MSQSQGIAFIIGGGPRIGHSVAQAFIQDGMKVAIGRRNPDRSKAQKHGWFAVEMDLNNLNSIHKAFETVRSQLGEPNVVVYNAAALTFAAADDPFGISVEQYVSDLEINVIGAYACLHESIINFKALSKAEVSAPKVPKVFIATGNVVPFQPLPMAMTLGSGKAALVHLIEVGNQAYGSMGFRFYFASQITKEGGPVPYEDVDAGAHGREYMELICRKDLGVWDVRFT